MISGRIRKRLEALGRADDAFKPVTVIIIRAFAPSENGPVDKGPFNAQVLASKTAKGTTIKRKDEESEADFLSRVDSAHIAIHGFPMEQQA